MHTRTCLVLAYALQVLAEFEGRPVTKLFVQLLVAFGQGFAARFGWNLVRWLDGFVLSWGHGQILRLWQRVSKA